MPPDPSIPSIAERPREPVAQLPTEPGANWAVLASAAAHVVFLGIAAFAITAAPVPGPPPAIPVSFVTPQELEAAAPARVPQTPPDPDGFTVPAPPVDPAAGMTTATNFFAGTVLNDPENRAIREALPTLATEERIVQLCNIEGLEQLRLATADGTTAEALIAYAFGEPTIAGLTLDADGGAFRTGGRWYAVRFSCTVGADFESVTEFRFAAGEPIPEEEWEAHYLTGGDDDE